MSKPFEDMSGLDRLVHEPARLAILTALGACRSCDFVYLQSLTAISNSSESEASSETARFGTLSNRTISLSDRSAIPASG